MIRRSLLALALAASCTPAHAVLHGPEPWTATRAAPCDGACPVTTWALERMVETGAIPAEVRARILAGDVPLTQVAIRDGDVLRGMGYARGGRPIWSPTWRVARLAPGRTVFADAHQVRVGAVTYQVMDVRLCRNPTVRLVPAPALGWLHGYAPALPTLLAVYAPNLWGWGGGFIGDRIWIVSPAGLPNPVQNIPGIIPAPPAEAPTPANLPAAGLMLLSALALVAWLGRPPGLRR